MNSPRTTLAFAGFGERWLRAGYRVCIALGLRAWTNRVRSRWLGKDLERTLGLDSAPVPPGLEAWKVRIDARTPPDSAGVSPEARFGMLSARKTEPPIARWAYGYLLARSHFGAGHLEVAFYYSGQTVSLYAFRNVAQGTARRWGWNLGRDCLGPPEGQALWNLVDGIAQLWSERGLHVRLCQPEECLALAVNPRWISPAQRKEVMARLYARYVHYQRWSTERAPRRAIRRAKSFHAI